MNCDCLSQEHCRALTNNLSEHNPKHQITGGEFLGVGLQYVNQVLVLRSYQEFEVMASMKKRDGTLGRERKKTVKIFHTFCPFCGVRQEENEPAEEVAES